MRTNLTPMIDVVFLLIIFFVLVAHFSVTGRAAMDLPELTGGRAMQLGGSTPAVIDVLSDQQGEAHISLGGRRFDFSDEGLAAMADRLRARQSEQPNLPVVVRAARGESSARVQRVLQACRAAGAGRVRVASQQREPSP